MQDIEHRIANLPGELLDLDLAAEDQFVAIAGTDELRCLLFEKKTVSLPVFVRFPIVRIIDEETVVVVDARTDKKRSNNAWIISRSGQVRCAFFVVDGVEEVLAFKSKIVVTYFDEGVFSGMSPSGEGVAVFNTNGQLLWGYKTKFGDDSVDVADCYCACQIDSARLFFLPYTEFPLVELNIETIHQKVYFVPEQLHGSSALSVHKDVAYLYSPYKFGEEMFALEIGSSEAKAVGRYPGPLRGLVGGRFLALGDSGYTIISLNE